MMMLARSPAKNPPSCKAWPGMSTFFEIAIGQALFFPLAIRFDQTYLVRKVIQGIFSAAPMIDI